MRNCWTGASNGNKRKLRGQTETIAERMKRDTAALMALPAVAFDACHKISTRVSSLSLVRYRSNDYSVPTQYGHREVLVKGYVDRVDICLGADMIARHVRSYSREEFIYNPLHYLALLEQKPRALDQAAPLQDWLLPEVFDRPRRVLEVRMERRGRKPRASVKSTEPRSYLSLLQMSGANRQAAKVYYD